MRKFVKFAVLAALGLSIGTASLAQRAGGKALDASAAAVIADANGKVVGPLVWVPNDPGYVYYGEVGAAYRVGGGVARVGFLASTDGTFGVLTRVYRAANLSFTTGDCSGQPYARYGLPRDYLPYAPVFVMPPISVGSSVIPAQVMRQTNARQYITGFSATDDNANCVVASSPYTGDHYVVEVIGSFPFVAPFSIK